jgi:hypothetical protein
VEFAGDWKGIQQHYRDGNKKDVIGDKFTLNDVMYIPILRHNLFSITKGIANGGTLSNEGDVLTLKFKNYTIRFDYKIKTKSGHIMAAIINPIGIMQDVHRDDLEPVDINVFHQTTHQCENHMRAMARRLGKRLTGSLTPCPCCAKAKSKRKKIAKETERLNLLPG